MSNSTSSSNRSSECDLVFDGAREVSPVPEEAYESFDLNVYSLGKPSGTITRTDRDPKDEEYWSSTAVSLLFSLFILLLMFS